MIRKNDPQHMHSNASCRRILMSFATVVAIMVHGLPAHSQQLQWTQQCVDLITWNAGGPAHLFRVGSVLFYGWEYGLPAYAAASFVGYSRIDAKKHHWYDVAASAGFAFTFSKIFTTRYRAPGLRYGAAISPEGGQFQLSYNF